VIGSDNHNGTIKARREREIGKNRYNMREPVCAGIVAG
jgi:hypothetical protein